MMDWIWLPLGVLWISWFCYRIWFGCPEDKRKEELFKLYRDWWDRTAHIREIQKIRSVEFPDEYFQAGYELMEKRKEQQEKQNENH